MHHYEKYERWWYTENKRTYANDSRPVLATSAARRSAAALASGRRCQLCPSKGEERQDGLPGAVGALRRASMRVSK